MFLLALSSKITAKKNNGRSGKVDLDNEFKENEGEVNRRISPGLLPIALSKL